MIISLKYRNANFFAFVTDIYSNCHNQGKLQCPDAGSSDEIEAIKACKGNTSPRAPNVIDVGLIKKMPEDWSDRQGPEFKNSVSVSGDPRSSNQAIQAVFAAGLAFNKGDMATAADTGLAYFAELNKKGSFVPVAGSSAKFAQGTTPLTILWDYNGLALMTN